MGVVVCDTYKKRCYRCSFACCAAADIVEYVWVIFDIAPSYCCDDLCFMIDNGEFVVALMKGVCEFDQHLVRSHAGLVAVMVLRHPVMPDGCFGTIFVCDFADVCSFGAVWIRQAGLSLGGCGNWGGCTWVAVGHGGCLSANR